MKFNWFQGLENTEGFRFSCDAWAFHRGYVEILEKIFIAMNFHCIAAQFFLEFLFAMRNAFKEKLLILDGEILWKECFPLHVPWKFDERQTQLCSRSRELHKKQLQNAIKELDILQILNI